MVVDPVSGKADVLVDNLTSAIDIAWRTRFFGGVDYYVLEFSTNLLASAPGRLKLVNAGSHDCGGRQSTGPQFHGS